MFLCVISRCLPVNYKCDVAGIVTYVGRYEREHTNSMLPTFVQTHCMADYLFELTEFWVQS